MVLLAGGALRDKLRGKEPNDYDLFFPSMDEARAVMGEVLNINGNEMTFHQYERWGQRCTYGCYDIVVRKFSTPRQVLNLFDYTVNAVGWVIGSREILAHPLFWSDLEYGLLRQVSLTEEPSRGRREKMRVKGFADVRFAEYLLQV